MPDDSLIAETARRILADHADPQDGGTAAPGAWKARLWPALEEAGLTTAWADEARGGGGAELMDGFDILRIAGHYAAPGPLAETLLAARLLAESGLDVPAGPLTLGPLRSGDALTLARGRVSGRLRAVPCAGSADRLAALATDPDDVPHAVLLNLADAQLHPRDVETSHERADLTFEAAAPEASAPSALDPEAFEALGAVARVQQIAGALETVLHLASTYVQERQAFGRPLSKFQAVQQNLARLGGEVAAGLTAAASSADTLAGLDRGEDLTPADVLLEVASAKIRAGEAAAEGAAIAHQAHGAIGFTAEYQLQRFTRALFAWRDDFGAESRWALRLGSHVAAEGAEALWPALTRR